MVSWFKRSLAMGFLHLLNLNEIQRDHIKLLERQCKIQKEAIDNLEGMLRELGKLP